jgi:hypothetical protein
MMMAKYRIGLVQTVTEETTVEVEAETRELAEIMAVGLANAGELEWSFLEAHDPIEVVTADCATADSPPAKE